MKIRLATPKDLPEIAELFCEYGQYEHNLDKNVEAPKLKEEQEQNKAHMNLGTKYILLEEEGKIVGILNFNIDKRGKEKVGVLHTLIITKAARGKGYGGKLVDFAFSNFKKQGCRRVRTFIHFANKNAQGFWKKYGFNLEHGYIASRRLK